MSDLLNSASLVLIPSGYKEDTVYSVVPSDGSGDMAFTRASNGTRVNSAGLVEVVSWNEITYSEQFQNAAWTKQNNGSTFTLTDNFTTAPNGTTTACKYTWTAMDSAGKYFSAYQSYNLPSNQYTFSVYMKGAVGGEKLYIYNYPTYAATLCTLTTEWQRFSVTFTNAQQFVYIGGEFGQGGMTTLPAGTAYIWGAQLNIGSTAKPYFPTIDRLNVPRLTYQNGGGGCPSLLLEKQSTNLQLYSQELDNAYWNKYDLTVTANNAISPDGTQNADLLTFDASATARLDKAVGGTYESQTHTVSVYAKVTSGTQQFRLKCTHANVIDYYSSDLTVTTEWQRFTFTQTFGASVGTGIVSGVINSSSGTAKSILFYGFQLEANSSYATSYIPTTSSSATRVADACFKTGISSLIGQTEGAFMIDVNLDVRASFSYFALSTSLGSAANYIGIGIGGGAIDYEVVVGSVLQAGITLTNSATGRFKIAGAYKANDFVLYINGTQIGADTSGTVPTCSEIGLFNYNDNQPLKYNQCALFKTRLTNAELAQLTA